MTAPGTFRISGRLDGHVVVDAPAGDVKVVLDGASISNVDGPALRVAAAKRVTVVLAAGSTNYLEDGGESEFDAALYSDAPITISGTGALEVNAVYEGISSTSHISIAGGHLVIRAGEDGLNANEDGVSRISVSGGYLDILSETGDGIDSNGTLEITGGTTVAIVTFGSGEGGLDADDGITITGGTVVATATRAPIPLRTPGPQKALILDVLPVPRVGDVLVVTGPDGEVVADVEAVQRYARLVFSSPDIRAGAAYTVNLNGEKVGEVEPGRISRVGPGHPGVLPR